MKQNVKREYRGFFDPEYVNKDGLCEWCGNSKGSVEHDICNTQFKKTSEISGIPVEELLKLSIEERHNIYRDIVATERAKREM